MKKLTFIFLFLICDFCYSFDVQAFLDKHTSTSNFNIESYIYKNGPYKGEIKFSKLMLDYGKDLNKAVESLGVKFKRIDDSTVVVISPFEEKTIIGGHDAYSNHVSYGKCLVTSWWPINNKSHYKRMKLVTCSNGTVIEINQYGGLNTIYQGTSIQKCTEYWNGITMTCKKIIIMEKGADDIFEEAYMDSVTTREFMRKAYGLTLLVTDYHSNGIPHIYKNASSDNQFFVADSLGTFYKMVEYEDGFRYDKFFPMKEDESPIMITNDSINFNPDYIYILNDDYSAIIDSVKRED